MLNDENVESTLIFICNPLLNYLRTVVVVVYPLLPAYYLLNVQA